MADDTKLVDALKAIGGLKPEQPDPFHDKINCPYCPQSFKSLRGIDAHVYKDHNG